MRKHRGFYKVTRRGPKTHKKVAQAVKHYHKLQTRVKEEGETAWLIDAMERVTLKLKKYGVTP